jgi:hypothetical protein
MAQPAAFRLVGEIAQSPPGKPMVQQSSRDLGDPLRDEECRHQCSAPELIRHRWIFSGDPLENLVSSGECEIGAETGSRRRP